MEIKETLTEFGDPEKVGVIMQKLNLSMDDFNEPTRLDRVKEVVEFLMTQEDPEFFISRAIGSKQVDRLDFMAEYIDFHRQMGEAREKLDKINQAIEQYDPEGVTVQDKVEALYHDKRDLQGRIDSLQSEISIYEK